MTSHDVVVVGGGPAGAATAGLLARRGYDVALVDRATFPRDKACAEYCSPGVEAALRRIGAWDLIEHESPRRLRGMVLYFEGSKSLPVQYERGGRESFAFSLPRSRLDDALLRFAARSGAAIMEGRRAKSVHMGSNTVSVDTVSPTGSHDILAGRVIVGADGMHSQVARSLGLESGSHWPQRLGLIAHYEDVTSFDDWGEMHVGKDVYCGLNPLPEGMLNVGLVVPLAYGRRTKGGVEHLFARAIAALPVVAARLRRAKRVTPIRGMGPMRRRVKPVCGTGFVLVGDAAGFLDPFTGEGIFRSIRGAEIAADVIDQALRAAPVCQSGGQPPAIPDLSWYAEKRRRDFVAKERATWIIQSALSAPPVLEMLCGRVSSSSEARRVLGNVLGDSSPARALLHPKVAGALLSPW